MVGEQGSKEKWNQRCQVTQVSINVNDRDYMEFGVMNDDECSNTCIHFPSVLDTTLSRQQKLYKLKESKRVIQCQNRYKTVL